MKLTIIYSLPAGPLASGEILGIECNFDGRAIGNSSSNLPPNTAVAEVTFNEGTYGDLDRLINNYSNYTWNGTALVQKGGAVFNHRRITISDPLMPEATARAQKVTIFQNL